MQCVCAAVEVQYTFLHLEWEPYVSISHITLKKKEKKKANAPPLTCSTEVTVSTPSSTNISAECCSLKHRRGVGIPSMVVKEPLIREDAGTYEIILSPLVCFDSSLTFTGLPPLASCWAETACITVTASSRKQTSLVPFHSLNANMYRNIFCTYSEKWLVNFNITTECL